MRKTILLFLIVFAGYTVLAVLLYYPLVFQSKILIAPDTLVPQASTIALDRVYEATGNYPLWQPWIFSGMPTVEAFSYLSGLYYPNLFFNLFHPDGIFLQLLHLAFAGFGVFLFLRNCRLTTIAAVFGGAVFMLNPYMTAMLVHGHGSQLMTAAYIPWMLWAAMRLVECGGLTEAGILALVAGFQLQRAHVQIAYYSWMLTLLLLLFLVIFRRDSLHKNLRLFFLLLLALACGVGMSASIYLPASQYSAYSVRGMAVGGGGAAWDYATLWSMHPLELLTFLVPGCFGFGGVTYWGFMPFTDFPNYAGIVVLMLAIGGAALRRKEPMTWLFVAGLLLFLLMSFGSFFSPVFNLFYYAAPLFSRFRVPSMALIMVYLILVFFASAGVHELLYCQGDRLKKPLYRGVLALAGMLLLCLVFEQSIEVFFRSLFPDPSVGSFNLAFMVNKVRWENLKESFLVVILVLTLSSGVLWLLVKNMLSRKLTVALLLLIALGDLILLDMQIVNPSAASLRSPVFTDSRVMDSAFRHDDITRFLASRKGLFRIYPAGPLFTENKFALFGIESAGGYHPAKLKLYEEFLAKTGNLASLNILRMLNVAYLITPEPVAHPSLEPVKTGSLQLANGPVMVYVYSLKGSTPRAWFAGRVSGLNSEEALFSRLLDDHASSGEAYVDGSLWTGSRTFSAATVTSLVALPESMILKVSAPGEAFLVVSEIYYPLRWKVSVDGKPASMARVNGLLRGVVVPAGSREVRFMYDRSGFETGRRISLGAFTAAMLLIAGGLLEGRFRRKPGK
ncbi:MAG: hypothetical protein HKK66_02235 [Chlorobiaceae bacterium]|nr:hypothetical protein [Chlorobiaceae bacterium]